MKTKRRINKKELKKESISWILVHVLDNCTEKGVRDGFCSASRATRKRSVTRHIDVDMQT